MDDQRLPRVLIFWTEINGYVASCLRELVAQGGVDVRMVAGAPGAMIQNNGFALCEFRDLPIELLDKQQLESIGCIASYIERYKPEFVCLPGWRMKGIRKVVSHPCVRDAKLFLLSDNPARSCFGQLLRRVAFWSYLRRIDKVVVPGERGWQFAKGLGFSERRIHKGLYGVDFNSLSSALSERTGGASAWPRVFLFVGRLVSVKGIDVLVSAYERYRQSSPDPWSLRIVGRGPLADRARKCDGVEVCGFVQPSEMHSVFRHAGCLVMPSLFDAWPLAVVEACAAGLPVICSAACGSAVEVVRDGYNGRVCATGDVDQFARAMEWIEGHYTYMPEFGTRSQQLAGPYSSEQWASRWTDFFTMS